MNARALTGSALAAALRKAVAPAVSEALQRNAERLRQVLADARAERDLPSSPLWGSVGEGGTSSALRVGPPDIGAGTPHPDPLPQGERETELILAAPRVAGNLSLDITLTGENLFAREFGALDTAADPVIGPAIHRLKRRSR
jgi:hypothetical protein